MEVLDYKQLIDEAFDLDGKLLRVPDSGETLCSFHAVVRWLKNHKPFEAEPVVHAHWINGQCSNCGAGVATDCFEDFLSEYDNKYCYSCGAKMDEDTNGET